MRGRQEAGEPVQDVQASVAQVKEEEIAERLLLREERLPERPEVADFERRADYREMLVERCHHFRRLLVHLFLQAWSTFFQMIENGLRRRERERMADECTSEVRHAD